ncbi:hypothetical protein ACQ4PT_006095 [Festuca glaucescens]
MSHCLQTVTMSDVAVSWHTAKMLKLSELLDNATVSELHLNFRSEKIWVKSEGPRELWPVFHKLRFLNLTDHSEECDPAWTLSILEGAPSLEELCLRVCNRCELTWDEEERKAFEFSKDKKDTGLEREISASDFKHHNLAVLRIFGFQLEDKFLDYVSSVMESAVNLKDIYLYHFAAFKNATTVLPLASASSPSLHAVYTKLGFLAYARVTNGFIQAYCATGRVTDARRVFDGMPRPDTVSFNCMIQGY